MCEMCTGTASFDPRRHQSATNAEATEGWLANFPMPGGDDDEDDDTPVVSLPTATLDELADYLTDGYWQASGEEARSFADVIGNSSDHVITVDLTGLTAEGQRLARWALEAWELVAEVQFTEVQTDGDITFDDEENGAYVSYETDGLGRLHADLNISTDWLDAYGTTMDAYSYSTYLHEIGHTLGLGHMGNYNGNSGSATFANDSYQVSVMSYIAQDLNPNIDADRAFAAGPMIADILAVQSIYGASEVTTGDTTWGLSGTYSRQFAALFSADEDSNPVGFALYDAGGDADLIDLRASPGRGDRLNLNAESFSDVAGLVGNLAIARDTEIENATMGRGRDTVIGNDADNTIWGGGGRDRLYGRSGEDRLIGGGGSDRLFGGAMNDKLFGKSGSDYLDGGEGNDILFGGNGSDDFFFGFGHDRDRIKDFTLGEDRLLFTALDFGTQDAEDFVDTYATVTGRGIRFDMGDDLTSGGASNDRLILIGVFDLDALVDDIVFV